jgi:hypothetical protein
MVVQETVGSIASLPPYLEYSGELHLTRSRRWVQVVVGVVGDVGNVDGSHGHGAFRRPLLDWTGFSDPWPRYPWYLGEPRPLSCLQPFFPLDCVVPALHPSEHSKEPSEMI